MVTRTRSHRWQIGVLGAALLAELLVLIAHPLFGLGPDRPRFTTTPPGLAFSTPAPPPARTRLLALAAAARRQPATRQGDYVYVSRRTWSIDDQRAHGANSALRIKEIRGWRSPRDGSGRVATVTQTGDRSRSGSEVLPAGFGLPRLTGSQVALAHRLHFGYPSTRPLTEQFIALTEIASVEPVDGAARVSLLRLLARLPGLVDSGTTVDRAGRTGVAVSLTGSGDPSIRYTLIFDPRTGGLLESDETLVGGSIAGAQQGDVIAYTTIRAAGRVPAVGMVPRASGAS